MAYTTINDPSEYFHSQLYTGTGSSHSVTNDANAGDFKPDWVWIKERSSSGGHKIYDSTRGVQQAVQSQSTGAEATTAQGLTAFNTDGFTVGSDGGHNQSSATYVAWQWKCNGGTTSSNTDGSITSTVQVNTDAGFSIGTFTGNGTSGATVGHGLGVKPDMIITKSRNNPSGAAMNWFVAHKGIDDMDGTSALFLNSTSAKQVASSLWGNTAPTTSVFSLGSNAAVNYTGNDMLFYAFKEKQGYSKFGEFYGNGNTNGQFVYTGFAPMFLVLRDLAGGGWFTFDIKRDTYNAAEKRLALNNSDAEATGGFTNVVDILSNGFKLRNTDTAWNGSGRNYIYIAFANHPFVTSTGIPTTVR